MKKRIMLILIDGRKKNAVNVQKILTGWGCLIKTRLGIHDGVLEDCSDSGLLFLELVGDQNQHEQLRDKINVLDGVHAKLIDLEV